jgi:flagellar biosynthesis anti-sigma factor FlgM
MVNPVGSSGLGPVDATRVSPKAPISRDTKRDTRINDGDTPAVRYAKLGPPIDVNRVGEVRAAITNGSYTVDADRLAAAMLALDLPEKVK